MTAKDFKEIPLDKLGHCTADVSSVCQSCNVPRDEVGQCIYVRRKGCQAGCCDICGGTPDGCDHICPKLDGDQVCRVCGCSEEDACEGGCSWVEEDLCSACSEKGVTS